MNESRSGQTARRTMVAVIVALTGASIAYRALATRNLEHSALVFIGIPAILALLLVAVQPRTAKGTIHKTIALGLCLSAVLFGEAIVCILMAAPLFFAVGGVMSWGANDGLDQRDEGGVDVRKLGILMLIPMSLEGVIPHYELPREYSVTVTRVVAGTPDEVRAQLAAPMAFNAPLPMFFRLGYPVPGSVSGSGLQPGDSRSIQFRHGHHPGTLTLAVTASHGSGVVFAATSDDSYITHWLTWRRAEVAWREVAPGRTEVTWSLHYWRRLDPAWYFGPLERYGVTLAADYLIETLATPRSR
jgi:hypothetical protein